MRTGPQAVAAARTWRTNSRGMCLYTVQTWLGAPWSGPWAEDAWHRWGGHHHGQHPPPGVPVYWHNPRSKFGHIALSVGGGRVRSTDWPRARRVSEATIDAITAGWNLRYLGWSDRFSGGTIQGIGTTPPPPPLHHPGEHHLDAAPPHQRPETRWLLGQMKPVIDHTRAKVDQLERDVEALKAGR